MAGHSPGDDIWPRNGSLCFLVPPGSYRLRRTYGHMGCRTDRNETGLCSAPCQTVACGEAEAEDAWRRLGTLDAAGDVVLLLSGTAGEDKDMGAAIGGDSRRLRTV